MGFLRLSNRKTPGIAEILINVFKNSGEVNENVNSFCQQILDRAVWPRTWITLMHIVGPEKGKCWRMHKLLNCFINSRHNWFCLRSYKEQSHTWGEKRKMNRQVSKRATAVHAHILRSSLSYSVSNVLTQMFILLGSHHGFCASSGKTLLLYRAADGWGTVCATQTPKHLLALDINHLLNQQEKKYSASPAEYY